MFKPTQDEGIPLPQKALNEPLTIEVRGRDENL